VLRGLRGGCPFEANLICACACVRGRGWDRNGRGQKVSQPFETRYGKGLSVQLFSPLL